MSNNLDYPEITENQANKYVTANDQAAILDAALTETILVDMTGGNEELSMFDYTRNLVYTVDVGSNSGRELTLPENKKLSVIRSLPANTVSFNIVRGSSSVIVEPGVTALVYTDGTENGLFSAVFSESEFTEAPNDGNMYARRNEGWSPLFAPGKIIDTTDYTLVIGDAGRKLLIDNSGSSIVKVPPNTSVTFPLWTEIHILWYGEGQPTIQADDTAVTVIPTEGFTPVMFARYGVATLTKVDTDTWILFGGLTPEVTTT